MEDGGRHRGRQQEAEVESAEPLHQGAGVERCVDSEQTYRRAFPEGARDPAWALWLEVWNRSQSADDEVRARQLELELAWHRDLVALFVEGAARGEFRAVDADRFATRTRALLDGFGTHLRCHSAGWTPARSRP